MNFLEKAYSVTIQEVVDGFKTSLKNGLSSSEIKRREIIFGKNALAEEKISYIKIFFRQFSNVLVYVLLVASFFSLFAGRLVDFFTIIFIILINSLIGFWQEVKAEISIKALQKLTESKEKVIRDSTAQTISSTELVPGDIVLLFEGSIITADIRLIDSSSLMIDESSITGESIPTEKNHTLVIKEDAFVYDQKNMAFAGSTVVRGTAKGVVTRTGKNTYFSAIAERAKEPSPDSPFSKAIKYFAKFYTLCLIILLLVIGGFAYLQGRELLDIAYILIAELVSAVPEGLPIVVTLVMVIGAIALSKKNTLVRYLPAVETLGSTTVIASDKTGTITEGKIEVKEVYALKEDQLKIVAGLCNDSHSNKGDPIDVALASWSDSIYEDRDKYPRIWSYAFDSEKRVMASAHKMGESNTILIKGAYEELKKRALNTEDLPYIEEQLEKMSNEGLRVLAFGMGSFTSENIDEAKINIVGLIGFLDAPKKNVNMAVEAAKKAGVAVIMITGDSLLTAKAVAREVGIYKEGDLILSGEDIQDLSDKELSTKLKRTTVLARILPDHKYRVVKILQEAGEIVAVSGDGVNDVPALKKADLGIAMGSGTEAAKSVAKMVITDNNLNIIVEAIRNGRIIADNITKVIYYLLSSSLMEIFLISIAIILGMPIPLTPIQILWINLVTDGVQDKAFPFAKEEGDVMKRLPKKLNKQFFNSQQIWRVMFFGIIMGLISLELYKYLLKNYTYEVALTISFTSVVMAQWLNGIQSQKQKEPFFKNIKRSFSINPYIFVGIGAGIALQLFAVYGANNVFQTEKIPLSTWRYPIYISIISFFVVEIRKWIEILFYYLIKKRKAY